MSTASSTLQPTPSSTAPPAATSSGGSGSGDGGNTKPFLFFVALGFGVVFANLWIIVGIKYCFRYNNRARQALIDQENANLDMGAVPANRRRRREKKLMTMDEVNERFPLTRYKVWRATREREGLPAEGGISAPPSRAASIRAAAAAVEREAPDSTKSGPISATTAEVPKDAADAPHNESTSAPAPTGQEATNTTSTEKDVNASGTNQQPPGAGAQAHAPEFFAPTGTADSHANDSNTDLSTTDDDPIQGALPESMLEQANPGDNCAICIDSLDEDDEVRGLTCGHAFHASCVDPWLTSRRASCPLCKHDYYVPKPRPGGTDTAAPATPQPPPPLVTRPHMLFGGFRANAPDQDRERPRAALSLFGLGSPSRPQPPRDERQARQQRHRERQARRAQQQQQQQAEQQRQPDAPATDDSQAPPREGIFQRVGHVVSAPRSWLPRRARPAGSATAADGTAAPSTPAQLEAATPAR